jgi:hypothetical protein
MVKVMRKLRAVTSIFVMLIIALTLVKSTTAQTPEEMETFFSSKYVGISIQVNATRETVPGADITIRLLVNCTSDAVYVDYLNLSVYGYKHIGYALEKDTLLPICVIKQHFLVHHNASRYNYTIPVPNDVWDLTYAELHSKYTVVSTPFGFDETFSITTVRNVLWEELEEKLEWLNQTYQKLNNTYWQLNNTVEQLNQTFWQMFQMNLTAESLARLNETYWSLKGSSNELGNTRTAVGILAVTTVFFVATTLYLVMRKPRESW